jgi:hypothetical protein
MAQERDELKIFDAWDAAKDDMSKKKTTNKETQAYKETEVAGLPKPAPQKAKPDPVARKAQASPADVEIFSGETGHIRSQIEETRSQMGGTIDAIQDKLSYANLSEQVSEHVSNAVETAKDAVFDATLGKAADMMKNITNDFSSTKFAKTVKSNPLPFALIGIGAGLLAYKTFAGRGTGSDRKHGVASRGNKPAGSQRSLVRGAQAAIHDVTDKITGAADTVYSGAGEVMSVAIDKVDNVKSATRSTFEHQIQENPLVIGAAAMALGAAVGMAIPATKYEEKLLGDAGQGLLDKAQSAASDLIDTTKQAVADAGRNALDQARSTVEG